LLRLEETPQARQNAEEHFQRSLECARQQQALSWELRAAMGLARLYRGQGQFREARDALGPVYTRFKEGFGTTDLMAANVLMGELGQS
jgi:predicted ATPase